MIWRIDGHFADGELTDLHFAEMVVLTCWIEEAAEKAEMPDVLAGMS